MKSAIQKFKDRLWDYEDLDIHASDLNDGDMEKLFEYFKSQNYGLRYFKSSGNHKGSQEINPESLFPVGPEDQNWDTVIVAVDGLEFSLDYDFGEDYFFMFFDTQDITNIKKAKRLAEFVKEIADQIGNTVQITSFKLGDIVATCSCGDDFLKTHPRWEKLSLKKPIKAKKRIT